MVRAKFRVTEVAQVEQPWTSPPFATKITAAAVTAAEGEDSIFGKATPNGTIQMLIVNPEAAAQFKISGKFYVDFIPAE